MSTPSTTRAALRTLISPGTRKALVLATLLIGPGAASGVAFSMPPEMRTYGGIASPTQLILSVLTPFTAALLTHDLRAPESARRSPTVEALRGRWSAAAIYGVAIGLYGAVVVAIATLVAARASTDPWAGTVSAVVGSLVVQLIPVGVGCAAGLLVSRAGPACLATIVVPLGFTLIIGLIAPRGETDWLTPLGAAGHLVPGPMTALTWTQWIVTAALWVVLPNWIGARRLQ